MKLPALGEIPSDSGMRELSETSDGSFAVGRNAEAILATGDGKTWVYTPRGYEKKRDAAE